MIDALWEAIPGAALVALLLVVFAVSVGTAINKMGHEPPDCEGTASDVCGLPAQVPHLGRSLEGRGGLHRLRAVPAGPSGGAAGRRVDDLELSGSELVAEHRGDYLAFYNDPLLSDEQRAAHSLAEVEEFRDGTVRAYCSCRRAVSHTLPSHAAAEAWLLTHSEIERSINTFCPGGES